MLRSKSILTSDANTMSALCDKVYCNTATWKCQHKFSTRYSRVLIKRAAISLRYEISLDIFSFTAGQTERSTGKYGIRVACTAWYRSDFPGHTVPTTSLL